jgi:cell division protein FtsL
VRLPGVEPEFRVVIGTRRRRAPRLRGWLLLAFTVLVAFLGLVYSRIALDRSAFVLDEIQQEMAAQEERYWELRLEVARLQEPDRIIGLAEEMGLVYPVEVRTVEVPGVGGTGTEGDDRWVDLKAILSARP